MNTYKLTRLAKNQCEISIEFSDAEIDAIFDAMTDYRNYGDYEDSLADSVQEKISSFSIMLQNAKSA
jgi:hypothetical protein